MKNLRRRIILGFYLFVVIGVFAPLCYQPDVAAWDFAGVRAGDFAPGQLEAHYLKHGYQFGKITQEQYLQDAQALLDAPAGGDVLEKTRPDGDIEHFRVSTGEFAVMTKRGRIRTYFKTDYGHWITRG
jgi:pyocin large subunit-like protein